MNWASTQRRRTIVIAITSGALAISFGAFKLVSNPAAAGASGRPGPRVVDGGRIQISPQRGLVATIPGPATSVLNVLAARLPLVSHPLLDLEAVASPDAPNTDEDQKALTLRYDLAVPGFVGSDITQALWEGNVFAGAVEDELAADGLQQPEFAIGTLVRPDGAREVVGGGVGHVVSDQVFDALPSNLGSVVAQNAKAIGLSVKGYSRMRGLQDMPIVRLQTSDPPRAARTLEGSGDLSVLFGAPVSDFEGAFVEVDDASGQPAYIYGAAPRAGAGTTWVRPGLPSNIHGIATG